MAEVLSAQARVEFATAYCSVALPPAHSTQHTCACRDYQRSISRRITALPAHYLFAMVLKFDLLLRRLLILTSQAHSGLRVLSQVSFIAQKDDGLKERRGADRRINVDHSQAQKHAGANEV